MVQWKNHSINCHRRGRFTQVLKLEIKAPESCYIERSICWQGTVSIQRWLCMRVGDMEHEWELLDIIGCSICWMKANLCNGYCSWEHIIKDCYFPQLELKSVIRSHFSVNVCWLWFSLLSVTPKPLQTRLLSNWLTLLIRCSTLVLNTSPNHLRWKTNIILYFWKPYIDQRYYQLCKD